jgi:hypothetical protein
MVLKMFLPKNLAFLTKIMLCTLFKKDHNGFFKYQCFRRKLAKFTEST